MRLAASLAPLLLSLACRTQGDGGTEATAAPARAAKTDPSKGAPPKGAPRLLPARPDGEISNLVRDRLRESAAESRKVVVYVGATWCEPCKTFHEALARGTLDQPLAGVDFLEFDLDRDRERLVSAGYVSRYIPLFAKPSVDGRASGTFIEGSIKGDGAAAEILPRLAPLLQ